MVPQGVVRKLQWWAEARLGGKFKWKGETMFHVDQPDWTSCGFYTASAIYCAVVKEIDMEDTPPAMERLYWFSRLVKSHLKMVSRTYYVMHEDLNIF